MRSICRLLIPVFPAGLGIAAVARPFPPAPRALGVPRLVLRGALISISRQRIEKSSLKPGLGSNEVEFRSRRRRDTGLGGHTEDGTDAGAEHPERFSPQDWKKKEREKLPLLRKMQRKREKGMVPLCCSIPWDQRLRFPPGHLSGQLLPHKRATPVKKLRLWSSHDIFLIKTPLEQPISLLSLAPQTPPSCGVDQP